MRVLFTSVNTKFASDSLAAAYIRVMDRIQQTAREFEERDDARILVIILMCPCCSDEPVLRTKNAVFVTPMRGLKKLGTVTVNPCLPPYLHPGVDNEAVTDEAYLDHFRAVIERALTRNQRK